MSQPPSIDPQNSLPTVAVLGATGLVGREMIRLLEKAEFPLRELRPLASAYPRTTTIRFRGEELAVQPTTEEALADVDLVFASAGGEVSRKWLPIAAAHGAICIDNTSAFRMDPDVPLVVPEVNPKALDDLKPGKGAIIANPNCSTIQLVVALQPLHQAFGLERVVVSTFQSISGAGQGALDAFRTQAQKAGQQNPPPTATNPHDVTPRIGDFDDDGHTTEERKMMLETVKILGTDLAVDVTCTRVPVEIGHAESVLLQAQRAIDPRVARDILSQAPGLELHEGPEPLTPASVAGSHNVHVSRLRSSHALPGGLQFWCAADNLLKGAAWNAVQIAQSLAPRWTPSIANN